MGSDALIQAKSGMGKTAVYAISILHQDPSPSDVKIKIKIKNKTFIYLKNNNY